MGEAELLVSRSGRVGRIRLNRPRALNSLTLGMVRAFSRALDDFEADGEIDAVLVTGEGERGLCAGGDIRALYDLRDRDKSPYKTFWREEYRLDWRIATYAKPYVAVMDGLVMGGGVGISAHGRCRIVTERTRLAMPETGIGFIPDVGGTWLLSRRDGVGLYMALAGVTVGAADAIHVGLADVFVESAQLPNLIERLEAISHRGEIETTIRAFARPPGAGGLERHKELLDRAMSAPRIEGALDYLRRCGSTFAREAADALAVKSPTSLKVTHALLKRALMSDRLETCLVNEYRTACSLLESHDLYEGIRAAVVEKDRNPKWAPAALQDVSDSSVEDILRGRGDPEPDFA